jgi:hypothetical protein
VCVLLATRAGCRRPVPRTAHTDTFAVAVSGGPAGSRARYGRLNRVKRNANSIPLILISTRFGRPRCRFLENFGRKARSNPSANPIKNPEPSTRPAIKRSALACLRSIASPEPLQAGFRRATRCKIEGRRGEECRHLEKSRRVGQKTALETLSLAVKRVIYRSYCDHHFVRKVK